MKTPRMILRNLLIGEQIPGSIGDRETRDEKEKIDQAFASLREIVLAKKKGKVELMIEIVKTEDGYKAKEKIDIYNQALQDIANLFGGEK